MKSSLFEYPKSASFGRVLPKSKIYEHGNPSSAVKELFIRQVDKIVWQYKLAPETVNIKGTSLVPEIQIFSVFLKGGELKTDVLRCIDQAIPFPIIFELCYEEKIKSIATYKRPNEADTKKWVLGEYYFESDWMPNDKPRKPLPIVFDLEALYEKLLTPLMPYPSRPGEGLHEVVERMEKIRSKQRELENCKAKLRKEKQFNCKVAINTELRKIKQELENLTCPLSAAAK